MKVRIHRGAHEIGGNCIEFESQGKRIVLDLGRPLNAGRDVVVPLPCIAGLGEERRTGTSTRAIMMAARSYSLDVRGGEDGASSGVASPSDGPRFR